jgi:hypothetical protein
VHWLIQRYHENGSKLTVQNMNGVALTARPGAIQIKYRNQCNGRVASANKQWDISINGDITLVTQHSTLIHNRSMTSEHMVIGLHAAATHHLNTRTSVLNPVSRVGDSPAHPTWLHG